MSSVQVEPEEGAVLRWQINPEQIRISVEKTLLVGLC
jgi:hypothetical protein